MPNSPMPFAAYVALELARAHGEDADATYSQASPYSSWVVSCHLYNDAAIARLEAHGFWQLTQRLWVWIKAD